MTSEKPTSRDLTDETPDGLRALFEECVRKERDLKTDKFEALRNNLIRDLSFPLAQFPSPPEVSDQDTIQLRVWRGDLYTTLITLLKGAKNNDTFWWWLAVWLRYESIREPEAILPPNVFQRLTEDANKRLKGFLATDDYNVLLVRTWLPYTEPLLWKTKCLRDKKEPRPRAELLRAGYSREAVDVVLEMKNGWRSAVEFTCGWLERRTVGKYKAATLRNSYSKVFGRDRLNRLKCSFCDNPAEGEFWVNGNSVLHCKAHGADRSPA